MIKRGFDIVFSILALVLLSPVLVVIIILIYIRMGKPILFRQERVGLRGSKFIIYKFRSMIEASGSPSLLTVGSRDPRVTPLGYILRKYKLDELPQIINVLKGEMSVVGPRPEVEKYVLMYSEEQRKVLQVKPGITDNASILFSDENEILSRYDDPEQTYIHLIMPAKLSLNLDYIAQRNMFLDIKILLTTVKKIFF